MRKTDSIQILYAQWLTTKQGKMLAVVDANALVFLQFEEYKYLQEQLAKLKKMYEMIFERKPLHDTVERELHQYFAGALQTFALPLALEGTPFQKLVWQKLQQIPYGKTCSYQDVARVIGIPTGCRAVARANASNPISVIVPCHRVIKKNGDLCGYAGGVQRKAWLLKHEDRG